MGQKRPYTPPDAAAVLRLWGLNRASDGLDWGRILDTRDAIAAGTYDPNGVKLIVAGRRLADAIFHPDLAEIERAEFDRQSEDPERWDGMS